MATAGEDLRDLIRAWSNQNPDVRTISYLEKKSGIDYSTVSRIWNGRNPECQTALAILHVVATRQEGLQYLRIHFPLAAKFHEPEYTKVQVLSDAETIRPILDNLLSFLVMNAAYAKIANKAFLKEQYGMAGVTIAESLVKGEQLRWEGDSLLPMGDQEFFTYESKADLIRAVQHIVNLSFADNGYPVALIGSLTDEEHEKLKAIVREFCHATKELIYSSKNGNNFVALSMVYVNLLQGVQS